MDTADIPTSDEGKAGGVEPYSAEEIASLKHGLEMGAMPAAIQADPKWGHGVWTRLIASWEASQAALAACQADRSDLEEGKRRLREQLHEVWAEAGVLRETATELVGMMPTLFGPAASAMMKLETALSSTPASQAYAERAAKIEGLLRRARSVIDGFMGDSDPIGDEDDPAMQTEEMKLMQDIAAALDGGAVPTGEEKP